MNELLTKGEEWFTAEVYLGLCQIEIFWGKNQEL